MTEPLRFADPPTKNRRRMSFDWDEIYDQLRANPGQWAILAEHGYMSTYNAIVQRKIKNFLPAMGIEARTSDNDLTGTPRRCTVWVRYTARLDVSLTVKQREKAMIVERKREKERQMNVSATETEG